MIIVTNTGKEFAVGWCGQSTIDGVLRFAVKDEEMTTVISTFTDTNETAKLVYVVDDMGNRFEYDGFTTFKGVDLMPDNSIVVSLMKT